MLFCLKTKVTIFNLPFDIKNFLIESSRIASGDTRIQGIHIDLDVMMKLTRIANVNYLYLIFISTEEHKK